MSKQHLVEIEAALNEGVHPGEVHGCSVPHAAIEALPDFWQLCDPGSYCPVTFNAKWGVPDELSIENPVVVHGQYLFVCGHDGDTCFYFKFELTLHVRHAQFSLTHAIGFFVQGELAACMRDPSRLMPTAEFGPNEQGLLDANHGEFSFHKFEAHLVGLLSDLVLLCGTRDGEPCDLAKHTGPVVLVIAAAAPKGAEAPDQFHEWQKCAQGFARIESVRL